MIAAHVHVTSDVAVKSASGQLVGVVLTAAAATATLTLYDNTAGSGIVLVTLSAVANTSVTWQPPLCYVASKGIYADIDGSGASATVVFL